MIIYIDIDNTICKTTNTDYINAKPICSNINIINTLYANNYIIYWTSRGVGSGINWYHFTKKQLDSWGCKYHELKCDKPIYDLFIDDKTYNSIPKYNQKKQIFTFLDLLLLSLQSFIKWCIYFYSTIILRGKI
jgi:hypothetical protein